MIEKLNAHARLPSDTRGNKCDNGTSNNSIIAQSFKFYKYLLQRRCDMHNQNKKKVDDCLQSHLIKDAVFDGILEIPKLQPFEGDLNVEMLVPFSARNRFASKNYALAFFEKDPEFYEVVNAPEDYVGDIKKFKFVVSPDCSMYRDAPLIAQLTNLNNSRKITYFWQERGAEMLPLVRWGSDLTYTNEVFREPPAFLGIEKHSPVCVSNYGCFKSRADKYFFREGFAAMLDYLKPNIVVLYGAKDKKLEELASNHGCRLIYFKDWMTYVHQRVDKNG